MKKNAMGVFSLIYYLNLFVILTAASVLFLFYNHPLMLNFPLMVLAFAASLLPLGRTVYLKFRGSESSGSEPGKDGAAKTAAQVLFYVLSLGIIINTFFNTALNDYFQPFSLFDLVIFIYLTALIFILILTVVSAVRIISKRAPSEGTNSALISVLLLILTTALWGSFQGDAPYPDIEGEEINLFQGGELGYKSYRIPSLLLIPEGSRLEDGTVLSDDLVLALSEARRNGSLDHGDIDLVMRISRDSGKSWEPQVLVRQWEDGVGKIGNPTPVFDKNTGRINLLHIGGTPSGDHDYFTYNMTSSDGGNSWSEPVFVNDNVVGPGHGIQFQGGSYDGRLLIPSYVKGSSFALFSDDNGASWQEGELLDDGNEAQITQVGDELLFTVRTDHSVAKPHGPFHKLFTRSSDGGESWAALEAAEDIKEPVCMSSVVTAAVGTESEILYYSHPDHYYNRARMAVVRSLDGGVSWETWKSVYEGPSAYSELAVTSGADLLVLFESGAVEYDERITLVRLTGK
jgi:sialidase-1